MKPLGISTPHLIIYKPSAVLTPHWALKPRVRRARHLQPRSPLPSTATHHLLHPHPVASNTWYVRWRTPSSAQCRESRRGYEGIAAFPRMQRPRSHNKELGCCFLVAGGISGDEKDGPLWSFWCELGVFVRLE